MKWVKNKRVYLKWMEVWSWMRSVSGLFLRFVTLGCSRSSSSDSRVPGSPRIRLLVLQQSACGIGYIYTIRDRECRVCACVSEWEGERERERQAEKKEWGGGTTDWKQKRLSPSFFFFIFRLWNVELCSRSHTPAPIAFDLQGNTFLI